jgi:hypothetical protein
LGGIGWRRGTVVDRPVIARQVVSCDTVESEFCRCRPASSAMVTGKTRPPRHIEEETFPCPVRIVTDKEEPIHEYR